MGFRCGVRPVGWTFETPDGSHKSLGTRYDVAPLHLLTSASLDALAAAVPAGIVDRRFRPNLLVASDYDEEAWLGATWTCGSVSGTVSEKTKRCGMTLIEQPGLPEHPDILRAILRHHARCLGVYSFVTAAGSIDIGDRFICS